MQVMSRVSGLPSSARASRPALVSTRATGKAANSTTSAPVPAAAPKPQAKPGAQAAAAPKPAAQKPAGRSQEDVWPKMLEAQRTGEVVEGKIVSTNEGGAMVQVGNLRGFIPYSKLDPARLKSGPAGDMGFLVGQKVRAKVVSAEQKDGRKSFLLSERKAQVAEALKNIKPGVVVSGTVTGIEDYGAFVQLSDVDVSGLVHKDEVSWAKIMTVDSVLKIGQKVQVQVLNVDQVNVRLALSIKRLTPDPLSASLDDMEWGPCVFPEPAQVTAMIGRMLNTPGITSVIPNRQLMDPSHVAQELEVYLEKPQAGQEDVHMIVARLGNLSTELKVESTLSRDQIKQLVKQLVK